ncbi:MAG: hypothetical protein K0U69_12335 [Actinomycetia bacterium]|nr:hypothetical protein [Actinomycetes bacterium]
MYLRFGPPIETARPAGVQAATWEATIKEQTQAALEAILTDLGGLRETDPYRNLNPFGWSKAV